MKRIRGRDYLFISVMMLMIGLLLLGPAKGKGKKVPLDDRHQSIYQGLKSGRTLAQTELVCATCHGGSATPLPKSHPPKDECLICHPLSA